MEMVSQPQLKMTIEIGFMLSSTVSDINAPLHYIYEVICVEHLRVDTSNVIKERIFVNKIVYNERKRCKVWNTKNLGITL